MRVNIYAEELTDRVEIISKEIEGKTYTAVRFYLELPATVGGVQHQAPFMHRPGDDDSSAVTFWGKQDLRELLKKALTLLDEHYNTPVTPSCAHEWRIVKHAEGNNGPVYECEKCGGRKTEIYSTAVEEKAPYNPRNQPVQQCQHQWGSVYLGDDGNGPPTECCVKCHKPR